MRRVRMQIWVDFEDDPTDEQIANVLANAIVQVEEPIYDNDSELEGHAVIRDSMLSWYHFRK